MSGPYFGRIATVETEIRVDVYAPWRFNAAGLPRYKLPWPLGSDHREGTVAFPFCPTDLTGRAPRPRPRITGIFDEGLV